MNGQEDPTKYREQKIIFIEWFLLYWGYYMQRAKEQHKIGKKQSIYWITHINKNSRDIVGFEELYGKATYYYGLMYYQGKGVVKDHDMALEILHIMMDTKQETKRESEEAEALYRKLYEEKYRMPYSSDQIHISQYFSVAEKYFNNGEHQKALELFEKLAKAGDTDSQVMAGLIYYEK